MKRQVFPVGLTLWGFYFHFCYVVSSQNNTLKGFFWVYQITDTFILRWHTKKKQRKTQSFDFNIQLLLPPTQTVTKYLLNIDFQLSCITSCNQIHWKKRFADTLKSALVWIFPPASFLWCTFDILGLLGNQQGMETHQMSSEWVLLIYCVAMG